MVIFTHVSTLFSSIVTIRSEICNMSKSVIQYNKKETVFFDKVDDRPYTYLVAQSAFYLLWKYTNYYDDNNCIWHKNSNK